MQPYGLNCRHFSKKKYPLWPDLGEILPQIAENCHKIITFSTNLSDFESHYIINFEQKLLQIGRFQAEFAQNRHFSAKFRAKSPQNQRIIAKIPTFWGILKGYTSAKNVGNSSFLPQNALILSKNSRNWPHFHQKCPDFGHFCPKSIDFLRNWEISCRYYIFQNIWNFPHFLEKSLKMWQKCHIFYDFS